MKTIIIIALTMASINCIANDLVYTKNFDGWSASLDTIKDGSLIYKEYEKIDFEVKYIETVIYPSYDVMFKHLLAEGVINLTNRDMERGALYNIHIGRIIHPSCTKEEIIKVLKKESINFIHYER